jgi:hypothetical protein
VVYFRGTALKSSTKRHISHCYGYLDLGMVDDAHEEIEKIDGEDRLHKEVLVSAIRVSPRFQVSAIRVSPRFHVLFD